MMAHAEIGYRVMKARKLIGLTDDEFAELTGIGPARLYAIEAGGSATQQELEQIYRIGLWKFEH